jgi:glycosyltransferase involved in cell wall biosynthesis
MKVLVVLAQPPLPEGNAPGKCALALLRGLALHGVEVRAVAARQHFATAGPVPDDLQVEVLDVPPPAGLRRQLARLQRPRDRLDGEFAARVRELARDVDVVHLEETETSWCDRGIDRPSVVHVHFRIRMDRPLGKPWRNEFRYVLEHAAAERLAARRHRYLLASSPVVAESLRRLALRAEVVVAPLALDPQYYPVGTPTGEPVAGLIGTAAWAPSGAAAHRLLDRIWPLVSRRVPDARLLVAGRGTLALGGPQAGAGVEILGEVASAPAFLRRLGLLLYPAPRGSGMKVKVLEAMACGVPVVTTRSGAEGIASCRGVLVAESDAELADLAIRLLHDADERRERGAAARETFLNHYVPAPATAPLVELYERMARC